MATVSILEQGSCGPGPHAGYARRSAEHAALKAILTMGMQRDESVIDFGPGSGEACRQFKRNGLRVLAVDLTGRATASGAAGVPMLVGAAPELPVEIQCDWGFCHSVLEDVPPGRVRDVLAFVRRSTRYSTFFSISLRSRQAAGLVRSVDWWAAELARFWTHVCVLAHEPGSHVEFFVSGRRD